MPRLSFSLLIRALILIAHSDLLHISAREGLLCSLPSKVSLRAFDVTE